MHLFTITEFSWWKWTRVANPNPQSSPKRSNHIKYQTSIKRIGLIIINPNFSGHYPINTIITAYRRITNFYYNGVLIIVLFLIFCAVEEVHPTTHALYIESLFFQRTIFLASRGSKLSLLFIFPVNEIIDHTWKLKFRFRKNQRFV